MSKGVDVSGHCYFMTPPPRLIAFVLAVGCTPDMPEDSDLPPTPPTPVELGCQGTSGTRVGECAPGFTLPTSDGQSFDVLTRPGRVVVHLTATDASPDPSVFLSGLGVDAVDVLTGIPSTLQDAETWRNAHGLTQAVAYDTDGGFGRDWSNTGQVPTILVLEQDGRVIARIHDQYATQLPNALAE